MRNLRNTFLFLILSLAFAPAAFAHGIHKTPIDDNYNNRIIDDSIFLSKDSMSAQDIQNFLNSKVAVCDSYHKDANGNPPSTPYICLKDYVDSNTGKTAAQLIYDESQSRGLNPKVILVTLQKEQGLVTDTWPFDSQYRSAMGYGCPETQTVCDSQYYGFYNQVHLGSGLLRAGEARDCGDTSTLPGYSIDSEWRKGNVVSVDGKPTYMGTCATGSLYNYTPHRPDSAWLPAADGNHYYGNYNFIYYFSTWFGLPYVTYSSNSAYAKSPCNIPQFDSSQVGRLYHPELEDYFYTTSRTDACQAVKTGYVWDGIVFSNYVPDSSTEPVYRLTGVGGHLFTTSDAVKTDYINNRGYTYEGIAFYAKTSATGNIPVYCMVKNGTVLYTSATGEESIFQSAGFTNAGLAFYTVPINQNNSVHVFRLSRGAHRLYTTSSYEKDIAQIYYGFTWESSSDLTAFSSPNANLTPVYRLSTADHHFYTTNRGERDIAVLFYGYSSEGSMFYGYPSGTAQTSSVYRLTDPNGNRLYTQSSVEKDLATSKYGYTYESVDWNLNQ